MSAESLMIVQGGGPTAVFNASLASIITEALKQPRIGRVFGARSGMKGLTTGDLLDLSHLRKDELQLLRSSPGAALSSSRFKPTDEDLERCVANLRRLNVQYVTFMGGNGTMRGAERFRAFCRDVCFDVQIIGIPKTIDNDITLTDRCPGFASAARFVAQSTIDLAMDIRSLPQPISIFETLGRDVGWLAASATLAKREADDAPHLVYVPEIPFSKETFLSDLDSVVSRLGWAVVIVSEGIIYADGTPVFEQHIASAKNAANRPLIGGVAQFLSGVVTENLGLRCRSEKPGLIGRSCTALVSARDQSDAELVGREGIRALLRGETDQMVALSPFDPTGATFKLVPLHAVSGITRTIPPAWLSEDGLAVNESFRSYVRPLTGELFHYVPTLGTALSFG